MHKKPNSGAYCLALSESKQHEALCGARASSEPYIKLGCTKKTRFSMPLPTVSRRDGQYVKRYYVTVWKPGKFELQSSWFFDPFLSNKVSGF